MKYRILSMMSLVVLGGCMTGPTPEQYEKMAENLNNINKNLEVISKAIEEQNRMMVALGGDSSMGSRRGNLARLAKIEKLPPNSTEEQVKEYISQIVQASTGQHSYSSSDIQVKMFKAIGKGHFKAIIELLKTDDFRHAFHLRQALPELADEKDKDEIIKNMEIIPELAPIAIKMGWGDEYKDKLWDIMERGENIWELQRVIGPLIKTDKDRERVIKVYINGRNSTELFESIKSFPNVDLADVTTRAWDVQKYAQEWQRNKYAMDAAENGNVDALGTLIISLNTRGSNLLNSGQNIGARLMKLTKQPLIPQELYDWYSSNKDKLYFDKETGTFKVKGNTTGS